MPFLKGKKARYFACNQDAVIPEEENICHVFNRRRSRRQLKVSHGDHLLLGEPLLAHTLELRGIL